MRKEAIPTAETNKRYYWLKLKDDFFRQKEIKQLRKIAGGEVFIIIYLKMLLRSLQDDGKLYYEGIEDDFPAELALDIDEDVENVKITIAYLQAKGILVQSSTDEYKLLTAGEMTGSEGYSAERVRRFRSKQQLALQCNADVTLCNEEKREKREEKREDTDTSRKRSVFVPPSLDEVKEYAVEKNWSLKECNPDEFINYYESNGWKVGKNKMAKWKAAASRWVAKYRREHGVSGDSLADTDVDNTVGPFGAWRV